MTTKYYPQEGNTVTTCDVGTAEDHDLSKTQGSTTTQSRNTEVLSTWTAIATYDLDVSADSPVTGTHNFSISISSIDRTDVRVQIGSITSGCAEDNVSAVSSTFTTAAVHTGSLSLTWGGSGTYLRFSIQAQRNQTHGTRQVTWDVEDVDTWVEAPWGGSTRRRAMVT